MYYPSSALGALRIYLHADHQGSIIAQSNKDGTGIQKLTYDSFGIPKYSNANRFGYTGQIWFKELGLFYCKARMYDPILGRFLQADPIFYADNMNMYAYVGNDPVNKIDPTGTTCTMNDGKASCKVDDPGKLKPKEVARIEKAYTKAVNKLLKDPNKTSKITVKDKSFTVKAGDQAKALIGAKVVAGTGTKARGHAEGGPLRPETEDGGQKITINRNVLSDAGEDRISRTLIHESIHLNPAEKVMQELWDADPKQFNKDHRDPYNNAAHELF